MGEELAIDVAAEGLTLEDCRRQIEFEIFPHFRHRYAPGVTHNTEHWFRWRCRVSAALFSASTSRRWLDAPEAARLTKSG